MFKLLSLFAKFVQTKIGESLSESAIMFASEMMLSTFLKAEKPVATLNNGNAIIILKWSFEQKG